jgi:hypothetical protein
MKQTAVEWLVEMLDLPPNNYLIEQAKEMEKQQIIDAYADGVKETKSRCEYDNAKEYYNEKFNK